MYRKRTNLKFLKPTNNKHVVLLKKFFSFVQRVCINNRHTSLFLNPDHNLFPEYMARQREFKQIKRGFNHKTR